MALQSPVLRAVPMTCYSCLPWEERSAHESVMRKNRVCYKQKSEPRVGLPGISSASVLVDLPCSYQ